MTFYLSDSFLLNQVFCISCLICEPWLFWAYKKWMIIDFYIWYHYIFNPYPPNPLLSGCIFYIMALDVPVSGGPPQDRFIIDFLGLPLLTPINFNTNMDK